MATEYDSRVVAARWLTAAVVELSLAKPEGLTFAAGQRLQVNMAGSRRDYTIASPPQAQSLLLCIRKFDHGKVSSALSRCRPGDPLRFSAPHGYFLFRSTDQPAVFAATGTGIAPFAAMLSAGARPLYLLHGARRPDELLYRDRLKPRCHAYVPCLSASDRALPDAFAGRVTEFLDTRLAPGTYDFYFCGRQAMIRDGLWIVDRRFPGSRVFTEAFY